MMTIAALLIALCPAATWMSCSDDDVPNPLAESKGQVEVSVSEMSFDYKNDGSEGDVQTFTVKGGTAYATGKQDWIQVERTSDYTVMGDSEYQVTCEVNKGNTERVGELLVNLNGAFTVITVRQAYAKNLDEATHNFSTAMTLAQKMYPGWNLGNTMEAPAGEMAWQGTMTTQAIIDYVKAQGFKSVRIPCSWMCHLGDDGQIDYDWLSRVKDIVDYCINAGLYVVLNDHYDEGWIEVLGFSRSASRYWAVDEDYIKEKEGQLKNLWTMLANEFINYDEHLILAGLNEPFQNYDLFNGRHAELTPILLRYNQAFVDAVRATGGNNAKRTLVVQGPATNMTSTLEDAFTMPVDGSQTGYLMCEVHYYEPWSFCGEESGTYYWGEANQHTGNNSTYAGEDYLIDLFARMRDKFADNGVPVVIGEYGANWRDLSGTEGASQEKHDASVKLFFELVNQEAVKNGMVPFAWDINSADRQGSKGTLTIIDRAKLSVFCTPAMEGIKTGTAAAAWME